MAAVRCEIKEIFIDDTGKIPVEVFNSEEPLILRGVVASWPIVKEGMKSTYGSLDYLRQFYTGRPITYYHGASELNGRMFYNDDCSGFNFNVGEADLNYLMGLLEECKDAESAPLYYVGSTRLEEWFPGFFQHNSLSFPEELKPLISIWFGNKSIVPAHYDCPNNIACNVAGKRTFTLFPPEQLENLYVGPLELTPSGRPVSMVDINSPDFNLFPKFKKALDAALVANLEAGDGLYMPSMWWHNVQARESCNVLVNYWWREVPHWMGNPENVLYHALLSLRGLSKTRRDIWKNIFDYYVFDASDEDLLHIPEKIQGILSSLDERKAKNIRAYLSEKLRN